MRRLLYGTAVALVTVAVLVGFMFFGFWGLLGFLFIAMLASGTDPKINPRPSPDRF